MANKHSNFPTNQLNNLPPEVCGSTVGCLRDLAAKGKPKDTNELKDRIDSYFAFCEERNLRPGVESLCLSLGITRQTLWTWCKGEDCSPEWAEICRNAKQFILTFLEAITMAGKLNPASSIFYLKNWGAYVDQVSVVGEEPEVKKRLTAADLPKLGMISDAEHGKDDL